VGRAPLAPACRQPVSEEVSKALDCLGIDTKNFSGISILCANDIAVISLHRVTAYGQC